MYLLLNKAEMNLNFKSSAHLNYKSFNILKDEQTSIQLDKEAFSYEIQRFKMIQLFCATKGCTKNLKGLWTNSFNLIIASKI